MVPHPNNMHIQSIDGRSDPKQRGGDVVVDISVKKEVCTCMKVFCSPMCETRINLRQVQDDETSRKAAEQPSTSITMIPPLDSLTRGKERCRITVAFREEIQKICWYGEDTPAKNIEDVIRTAFGLPHHTPLLLKNAEGDVVAVSSSLPSNEIFHLQVGGGGGHTIISNNIRQIISRDNEMDEVENVKHEMSDIHSDNSSRSHSPSSLSSSPSSSHGAIMAVMHDDSPPISIKVFTTSIFIIHNSVT
jgi:hypothetical protein